MQAVLISPAILLFNLAGGGSSNDLMELYSLMFLCPDDLQLNKKQVNNTVANGNIDSFFDFMNIYY